MRNKKMMPVFIGVVAVLLIILGVVIGVSIAKEDGDKEPTQDVYLPTESEEVAQHPMYDRNIETVLIMGVDSRENILGKGSYSDSVIAVVFNHDAKTVKVASLLRDCMVEIEGYGLKKLNHANYYGGPELAVDTVNANFDLNVSEYVQVNFGNLVEVVDSIGGVEITLTQVECERLGFERFTKPGTYVLNGKEALAYSRLRKLAGEDRARSERQRNVLFALFEKTKKLSTEDSVALVEEMLDQIDTSYRSEEVTELLYCISRYKITGMEAFPLVYFDGTVKDEWYEVPTTLIDMNTALHAFLYDYEEYQPSEAVQKQSAILQDIASEPNKDYSN
ncbi:MAG: LCP family protein [Agathobacter sp.]|nr:LCP family protein [Agathobacter sp.]